MNIKDYCKQDVDGWHPMPTMLNFAPKGQEDNTCAFLHPDGIHLLASIKNWGNMNVIHVSIGPINGISKLSRDELDKLIMRETPFILDSFFGDREFTIQPADPRRPELTHYYSTI